MPSNTIIPLGNIFKVQDLPPLPDIITAQSEDPTCSLIIKILRDNFTPSGKDLPAAKFKFFKKFYNFHMPLGILLRIPVKASTSNPDFRVFVPTIVIPDPLTDLQNSIVSYFHSSPAGGHMGMNTTEFKTRGYYYWKNLKESVRAICSSCPHCLASKTFPSHDLMQYPVYRSDPYQELHIDVVKFKLPNSPIIGAVIVFNPFTHFLQGNIIDTESMTIIANWLYTSILLPRGCPGKLVFDSAFNVSAVNAVLSRLNILGGKSWPYSHNGVLAERPIGFLVQALRAMLGHVESIQKISLHETIPTLLSHAIAAYNCAPIPGGHGITPYLAEFGRDYNFPGITTLPPNSDSGSQTPPSTPEAIRSKLALLDSISASLKNLHLENSCAQALKSSMGKGYPIFSIGDKVTVTFEPRHMKLNNVANPHYEVTSQVGHQAYKVRNVSTNRSSTRLANQLKGVGKTARLTATSVLNSPTPGLPSPGSPPVCDIPETSPSSAQFPSVTVGTHIMFKGRLSARVQFGTVLESSASPPFIQIHMLIHQTSTHFPKLNGHPRINIYHPIAKRRFKPEWKYFEGDQLLVYGNASRSRPSDTPVTFTIYPDSHDVICHDFQLRPVSSGSSRNSRNTALTLSKALVSQVRALCQAWVPSRGTRPLGIDEGDTMPAATT